MSNRNLVIPLCRMSLTKDEIVSNLDERDLMFIKLMRRVENDEPAEFDIVLNSGNLDITMPGDERTVLKHFILGWASGDFFNLIENKLSSHNTVFSGSLNPNDFYKLFEIVTRDDFKFLSDEQYLALYEAMLTKPHPKPIGAYNPLGDFLYDECLEFTSSLKHYQEDSDFLRDLTALEEELLASKGLLDASMIQEQCDKINEYDSPYPYFVELNKDYFEELILASKEKGVTRGEYLLIKDTILRSNAFTKIFKKNEDQDLALEF